MLVAALSASSASAECGDSIAEARGFARGITIDFSLPERSRAGLPITIDWRKNAEYPEARPRVPLYLMLSAPPETRFAGRGFVVLAPGAAGPYGMRIGLDRARAFVPLHRGIDTARAGTVSITPYQAGARVYEWAIVTGGSCGEHALAQGQQSVDVVPGRAELVVQDRFMTEAPKERTRSRSGKYDLLTYSGRYEVVEAASGIKIFQGAGNAPNFSPTGRFVAARGVTEDHFSVVDLISRTELTIGTDEFLGWTHEDSFIIAGGSRSGELEIISSLVDEGTILSAAPGAHCCGAWDRTQFVIDLDRGFAGVFPMLADLAVPAVASKDNDAAQSEGGDPPVGHFESWNDDVKERYGVALQDIRFATAFAQKIALSHRSRDFPWLPHPANQDQLLVRHQRVTATLAQPGPSTKLIGRALPRGPATAGGIGSRAVADRAFARLAEFEIKTAAVSTISEALQLPAQAFVEGRSKAQKSLQTKAVEEIVRRVPPLRAAFDDRGLDSDSAICGVAEQSGKPYRISIGNVARIWRWRGHTGDRWAVQTLKYEGSGVFAYTCVFLLREGHPEPLADITLLLKPEGEDLDGWGTSISGDAVFVKIFASAEQGIAVARQIGNVLRVIDTETSRPFGASLPLVEGSALSDVRLTSDLKHVVQLNNDGRFFLHRTADARQVLSGAYIDDEIVVALDDGRYDTTYEGAHSVQVRFSGVPGVHTLSQFDSVLRRPGIARTVLDGGAVAPAEQVLAPPIAELTLEPNSENGRRRGKVVATAERELRKVQVYVDGQLVYAADASGRQLEVAFDIADPGGGRWISAIAIDRSNLVSRSSAIQIPGAARPRGVLRAVLAGADAYDGAGIPRLYSAKADASHLARALKTREKTAFASVELTVLQDRQVTAQSLLDAVRRAARATTPDDTLLVFYAGHGADGAQFGQPAAGLVLVTPETRLDDFGRSSLPWKALAQAMSESRGKVVVVLDACHSGLAGRETFAANDEAVEELLLARGVPTIVLAGSKGRQESEESGRGGGGRFTNALVAAIAGPSGSRRNLLDLSGLYRSVKGRVTSETDGRQTPWLARNHVVGEMSLF
jgi:Caspase domain